ncbi:MAG: SUMF1/EgtB/PvdO family nonheme iron enzyme, partial [Xanthobacteraceae bacterium]
VAAFACAVLLTCLGASPSQADRRVALVIGNGDYAHADKLANPVTDARRLKDTLDKLHFEVVFGENLDKRSLERTIARFADAVQEADVALVFFAGHGATFGDTPYVVPVDAQFSSLPEVPYELVPVETLIGELRRAKGLRIAILDACRDNAAERELKRTAARGGEISRGLARVKNPEGLILAYATQYLSTAADGDPSGDSPFTTALLNNIVTPGLDVKDLFFKVGREVIETTKGGQRPEVSVSFYDAYSLVPASSVGPPPASTLTTTAPSITREAERAWPLVKDTTNQAILEEYIKRYGETFYAALARARLDELKTAAGKAQPQVAIVAPPTQPARPSAGAAKPVVGVFPEVSVATPLPLERERALKPKDAFKECDKCPEMVVVPAGSFMMGLAEHELGHDSAHRGPASPQHLVTIAKPFAVGRFAVTVDQFAVFAAETGYDAGSKCYVVEETKAEEKPDHSWRNPGFAQTGSHPATCLDWNDAKAYVAWLTRKTGKTYRLLSEAEREYVTRAGTTTTFWWGSSIATSEANYNGSANHGNGEYRRGTVAVNSFRANPWGLYQVHGNVYEWVEDCWHENYQGAPSDGSAWVSGDCTRRGLRGGSWLEDARALAAAARARNGAGNRYDIDGFRVARTL